MSRQNIIEKLKINQTDVQQPCSSDTKYPTC